LMSLFSPHSRFKELNAKLKKTRVRRESLMTILLLLGLTFSNVSFSQNEDSHAGHNHDDHSGHDHSMHDGHDHSSHDPHQDVRSGHDHSNNQKVENNTQRSENSDPSNDVFNIMSVEHSEKLESLMVQDYDGRIVPLHTSCDQLLRKIYRKNTYEDKNAVQTIMSMHMYPQYWMKQPIIYVSSNLRESFNVGKHASFVDLSNANGDFKWMKEYDEAHKKT